MSTAMAYPRDLHTSKRLLFVRWAGLSLLLVAELMGLTVRFDMGTLTGNTSWWAELLGQAHHVPQIAVAIVTATLVFAGARLRDELGHLARHLYQPRSWWPFLLGHLVALVAFTQLTGIVVEGEIGATASPGAWFLTWVVSGTAVLALWVASAVPASFCLLLLRRVGGPLLVALLVGVVAWTAGQFTDSLWHPVGYSTLWLVQGLLRLVSSSVVCDFAAFRVGTAALHVGISPSCSGYESLGFTWVFVVAYLWFFRHELRFPQAFLLLPLGTVVIWVANAVRFASLLAIGTWGGRDLAMGALHSQAGWLAFNLVALGLVAFTRRSWFFTRKESFPAAVRRTSPTAE